MNPVCSLDKKLYDSKIKEIDFTQARMLVAEENKIFVAKQLKSLGIENYWLNHSKNADLFLWIILKAE